MNTLNTKRIEMFIRTHENRPEFALACPDDSYGAELFDQLGQFIEYCRSAAYEQSRGQSSVRESSGNVDATRKELERQLDAIYQTVRILAIKRPELADKFRPPHQLSAQELLTLARTYGNDAIPLKEELVKRNLGADFIADLGAASVAFDAALSERTLRHGRKIAATAEIKSVVERGLQTVRELRVIVRNTYANDSAKLALWESVSHVEKPPRRTRQKGAGNQSPPPAQS